MTLDWHYDSAVEAGQPPENAFTHIGFYLAWLIRHDLHDAKFFPGAHVAAVKSGEMTGSDLSDDGRIISDGAAPWPRWFLKQSAARRSPG